MGLIMGGGGWRESTGVVTREVGLLGIRGSGCVIANLVRVKQVAEDKEGPRRSVEKYNRGSSVKPIHKASVRIIGSKDNCFGSRG